METQDGNIESRKKSRVARKVAHIVKMIFIGLTMTVIFAFVFGYVIMWLWNWLMPAIFGLGVITFWQAFGILIMAKILFGAFGMRPRPPRSKFRNFNGHIADHKRAFFNDEWDFRCHPGNWRSYKKYWDEEGKAAYEEYVKKAEKKK